MGTTEQRTISSNATGTCVKRLKVGAIGLGIAVAMLAGTSPAQATVPNGPPFIDVFALYGHGQVAMEGSNFVTGHKVLVIIYDQDTNSDIFSEDVYADGDNHVDAFTTLKMPLCDHHHLYLYMYDVTKYAVAYWGPTTAGAC
jgi:hypothetical protein